MNTSILLLIALFIVSQTMTQISLPQGITFITQSEIDSFQVLFPACTEIIGSVNISGIGNSILRAV